MRNIVLLLSMLFLVGCGTAKTLVLQPVETTEKYSGIQIVSHNPTVAVPGEVITQMNTAIKTGLFETKKFSPGDDLTIQYTFVSHDEGSQFARWFWGGIGNAGEGSASVRVKYLDKAKNILAETQVDGRISSGFFGGTMNEVINRISENIVKFTVSTFAR